MSSSLGKLKPEIKARWRAALESGKYPQAKGQLRSDKGFCCLGVLGDLAVEDGLASWKTGGMGRHYLVVNTIEGSSSFPSSLLEWAFEVKPNVLDPCGVCNFKFSAESDCLTDRNDTGTTFPESSQLIEQHF